MIGDAQTQQVSVQVVAGKARVKLGAHQVSHDLPDHGGTGIPPTPYSRPRCAPPGDKALPSRDTSLSVTTGAPSWQV